MSVTKWSDVRRKTMTPERAAANQAAAEQLVLEMQLAEVRRMSGKTQQEVSEIAEIAQGDISKLEREGGDRLLSTLLRYVEALGGELELVARFGDKTIRLRGV